MIEDDEPPTEAVGNTPGSPGGGSMGGAAALPSAVAPRTTRGGVGTVCVRRFGVSREPLITPEPHISNGLVLPTVSLAAVTAVATAVAAAFA